MHWSGAECARSGGFAHTSGAVTIGNDEGAAYWAKVRFVAYTVRSMLRNYKVGGDGAGAGVVRGFGERGERPTELVGPERVERELDFEEELDWEDWLESELGSDSGAGMGALVAEGSRLEF